jgi:hypothetical protein
MPSMDAQPQPVDTHKKVDNTTHLYDVAPGKTDRLYQPGQSPNERVKNAFQSIDNWSNAANPLRFTPNDWGSFSDHKQNSDPGTQQKSPESAPVDADKKTLLDNNASKQERLAAAEKLAAKGDTNFSVQDQNGSHNYRIEQSKIGEDGRSFLHVYAADGKNNKSAESGNEHVMLRAISDGKGNFEQEKSSSGHKVNFEGDWWSRNAARFSAGDKSRKPDSEQHDESRKPARREDEKSHKPDTGEEDKPHNRRRQHGHKPERADESKQDNQKQAQGGHIHRKHGADEGSDEQPSRERSDAKPRKDHHLDAPEHPLEGTHTAIGTGYYPHNDSMNGGFYDERSSKKDPRPLHTLQDFLAGKTNEVTVAMDDKVPYGQKITIPEMDDKYRARLNELGYDHIPFVKKDSGSHFTGKGYSAIDICVKTKAETNDIEGNYTVNFVDNWGREGKGQPAGQDSNQQPDGNRANGQIDRNSRSDNKTQENKENPIQQGLEKIGEFASTLIQSAVKTAEEMTPGFLRRARHGETQLCATGVQESLAAAGHPEFYGTGDGWRMRNAFKNSPKFQQVNPEDARPGDVGVRHMKGHSDKGHVFTIVGKNKDGSLVEASDHITTLNWNSKRYDRTEIYRPVDS